MATDWLKLQTEYLRTDVSLRALAQQNGVSVAALGRVAADEGWAALRRAQRLLAVSPPETAEKTQHSAADQNRTRAPRSIRREGAAAQASTHAAEEEARAALPVAQADRMAKLMAIGDRLTDQLARATVELDKQVLKHKRKTREVVYDRPEAKGKPVEETVEENYHLEVVDAPVNCAGLQMLSATFKNLRDAARAVEGDGQSVGRVAELMKKLDDEAAREDG